MGSDTRLSFREDLLLFLESFPGIKDNDVVEIQNPITGHRFVLHARAWPVKFPLRSVSLRAALAEVPRSLLALTPLPPAPVPSR